MRKINGVAVLVLGIVSIFGPGCLAGIPAWILGNSALREMDAYGAEPQERSMVQIGRTIGIVTTVISVVIAAIFFVIFIVTGAFFAHAATTQSPPPSGLSFPSNGHPGLSAPSAD